MTQRIFDVENEKDIADLWDILSEEVIEIKKQAYGPSFKYYGDNDNVVSITSIIKINWHDKTEIKRPIQEATEADIDKICYFWDDDVKYPKQIGLLSEIKTNNSIFKYVLADSVCFAHCRRLTKQEVEELC